MMRFLLTLIVISCLPSFIKGEELDSIKIMRIASSHLKTNGCSMVKKSNTYCVVQRNDTTGYVIISLCGKRKIKIIGYSENSVWNINNMPPALLDWLRILDRNSESGQNASEKTRRALPHNDSKKHSISPLITCHWHQNSPYNDLAPIITDGNVKTVAGCVAIAAAQIAYYWRRDNPDRTLKDTPTYPYGAAPITMSIPKGTPNNWGLMQDRYADNDTPESKHAAAQLCYVIGTTSYLNYASSTGGSIFDAANAIYSQYELLSTYIRKSKYEQDEWENIIYSDISNGYPVMCSGAGNGAHAFVLDGYDSNTGFYHFNFGWGGSGDGYYPIDESVESMGGYYQGQAIVYNIHPRTRNIVANIAVDYVDNGNKREIYVSITNNSTLPIKRMCLYAVPGKGMLDLTQEPIWCSDTIKNDNVTSTFTYQLENMDNNVSYAFYLTDENGYVLSQSSIDAQTGIKDINSDTNGREQEYIFDLNGNRILNVRNSGIYIIKDKKQNRKIMITQ